MHAIGKMGSSLHITFIMVELFAEKGRYFCHLKLISPQKHNRQGNEVCKLMLKMIDRERQKAKIGSESMVVVEEGNTFSVEASTLCEEKVEQVKAPSGESSSNSKEDKEALSSPEEEDEEDEHFYTIIEDDEDIEDHPMTQKLL